VEEPGVSSTYISFAGPKGTKTSQYAAPAASSKRKKPAKMTPAPEPLFFLLIRLRRAIPSCQPFISKRRKKSVKRLVPSIVPGIRRALGFC
jgi:hypothetical protein